MTTESRLKDLTERQRQALSTYEAAQAAGMPFATYARSQGLPWRSLYDATVGLKRRGLLPGAVAPRRPARPASSPGRARFVAIDVARSTATSNVVCRLVRADGAAIECNAWPEPTWATAVLAVRSDAAA